MRKKAIFITGASGEVGHALIKKLAEDNNNLLLTLDLHPLPADIRHLTTHIEGNLLDNILLARMIS
ncbi:MAG: epimerase, partial [Anaerolineales bacterium]|nr:epimerase [Anaerolineales bacterium]